MTLDFKTLGEINPVEEVVDTPRWGGSIRVREPGLAGILRVQEAYGKVDDDAPDPAVLADAMVRVVAECAVDDTGARIFETIEQMEELRRRARADHRTLVALFNASKRVCLLDPTEAVKTAVGESEGEPTSG